MTSGISFEVHSSKEILHGLGVVEPNWRWWIARSGDVCSLKLSRQDLHTSSVTSAEHSVGLQAVARRNTARITIYFVLSGKLEVRDRLERRLLSIGASQVASVREAAGRRIAIEGTSSWLAYHIGESALRQHFESLTGSPYAQEFVLPLTDFCQSDAQGLFQTLRQAEQDLAHSSLEEQPLLARAHQQLALAKLFAKMPHNLANAIGRKPLTYAPRTLLRAEAFMRDNLSNPITIDNLAAAAGCTPRALQRMFRTYRHATPIGTLCNYRLSAAHCAIKAGQTQSITDLALSLQFSNPGRFSVLYKKAYGVSPSSTLRFARSECNDGDADE